MQNINFCLKIERKEKFQLQKTDTGLSVSLHLMPWINSSTGNFTLKMQIKLEVIISQDLIQIILKEKKKIQLSKLCNFFHFLNVFLNVLKVLNVFLNDLN